MTFQGIEEIEGYPFEHKQRWFSRKLISVLAKALQNSDDRRIRSLVNLMKHCFQKMQKISVREQFIIWRCLSRYALDKKQYIDMEFQNRISTDIRIQIMYSIKSKVF